MRPAASMSRVADVVAGRGKNSFRTGLANEEVGDEPLGGLPAAAPDGQGHGRLIALRAAGLR
eukprot:9155977-Pyramimonas_sp.AAC.1